MSIIPTSNDMYISRPLSTRVNGKLPPHPQLSTEMKMVQDAAMTGTGTFVPDGAPGCTPMTIAASEAAAGTMGVQLKAIDECGGLLSITSEQGVSEWTVEVVGGVQISVSRTCLSDAVAIVHAAVMAASSVSKLLTK